MTMNQLSGTEQEVLQSGHHWIDSNGDELIELLGELVSRPSVTGQEGRSGDRGSTVGYLHAYLRDRLKRGRLTTETISQEREYVGHSEERENIYAVLDGLGDRALVCTSHTDVVPPGSAGQWPDDDPYRLQEGRVTRLGTTEIKIEILEESFEREIRTELARSWDKRGFEVGQSSAVLIGRGAYDNKAAIVALAGSLLALETALDDSQYLGGDLIHGHLVDEEVYQVGAKQMVGWGSGDGWFDTRCKSYETVSGVVLEGSYGFAPVIGHRGLVWLELEATGESAHASTPSLGANAVVGMGKALATTDDVDYGNRIGSSFITDPLLGEITVASGTTIVGGNVHGIEDGTVDRDGLNTIPDWCEATFDIRIPRWEEFPEGIEDIKRDLCEQVEREAIEAADDIMFTARIPENGFFPPVALADNRESAREHPLVKTALASAAAVVGYEPPIEIAPGVTDAAFIYHGTGNPTLVEYGPAGALSHEPLEFVERKQVIQAAKSMIEFAVRELGVTTEVER